MVKQALATELLGLDDLEVDLQVRGIGELAGQNDLDGLPLGVELLDDGLALAAGDGPALAVERAHNQPRAGVDEALGPHHGADGVLALGKDGQLARLEPQAGAAALDIAPERALAGRRDGVVEAGEVPDRETRSVARDERVVLRAQPPGGHVERVGATLLEVEHPHGAAGGLGSAGSRRVGVRLVVRLIVRQGFGLSLPGVAIGDRDRLGPCGQPRHCEQDRAGERSGQDVGPRHLHRVFIGWRRGGA